MKDFDYDKDYRNKNKFRKTSTIFRTQCEFKSCERIELMQSKTYGSLINEDTTPYYICFECNKKQLEIFKQKEMNYTLTMKKK